MIADSWPRSLDDSFAKEEWGWNYDVSMYDLAKRILENIEDQYKEGKTLNLTGVDNNITNGKRMGH